MSSTPNKPSPGLSSGYQRAITIAHAHTGTQSYVWVEVRERSITGAVEFPLIDLSEILNLDIPSSKSAGTAFVERNLASISNYADGHLSIAGDGKAWKLHFLRPRVFGHAGGAYVHIDYEARTDGKRPPRLTITFDGIVESKPNHDALLIVKNGTGWGRLQKYEEETLAVDKNRLSHTISLMSPGWMSNLTAALSEGARRGRKRLMR